MYHKMLSRKKEVNKPRDVEIYFAIATQFFQQVQGHLTSYTQFTPVWESLAESILSMSRYIIATAVSSKDLPGANILFLGFEQSLKIFHQCIVHDKGALIQQPSSSSSEVIIPWLYPILSSLLSSQLYLNVLSSTQQQILCIISSIWKTFSQDIKLSMHLCSLFPSILVSDATGSGDPIDCTLFLIEELLPSLPHELGMKYLVPMILSSISKRSSNRNRSPPWKLLYSLVGWLILDEEEEGDMTQTQIYPKEYKIFCASTAHSCVMSIQDKETLIQMVLGNTGDSTCSLEQCGYYARILPFLLHV